MEKIFMKIFEQEKIDGLEEQIKASASVSYASYVEPCTTPSKTKHVKSLASVDDSDLYYVQSILVTTNWNKNDDIFDKAEVWAARNTPEDKPTNLEHNESDIVGHITSNWPVTMEGLLIDENSPVENLPDTYHILTGSVIYSGYSIPELKERSQKLIAEIESGEKYVSMECFFKGFDYGLLNKSTGEYKILSRNEATAYLTKYLRSYGGLGEHDNYKIGRVLRKITFSGKGFVDKPANPDSIIFTKDNLLNKNDNISLEKKDDFVISGVSKNQSNLNTVENSTMNEVTSVAETEQKIETQTETTPVEEVTVTEVASTNTDELQNSIKVHEEDTEAAKKLKIKEDEDAKDEENKNLKAALESANKIITGYKILEKEVAKKDEEVKKMKAELDTALESIAAYKKSEEAAMKKEKKMKRVAQLLEKGVDNEIALSTVDKFESVDDEAFEAVVLLAGKMPPWLKDKTEDKTDEEDKKSKKKASETTSATADPAVLETAEVEENVTLTVGENEVENSVSSTRAALADFVQSRLGTVTK
jgi:hypothetical protein